MIPIVVLLLGRSAAAQQGSIQILSGTLVTTGSPARTGTTESYQPDFGFALLQPTTDFGTVQVDLHAVRGHSDPRLGRGLLALHGMKRAGFAWNIEFGDSTHTPFVTGYGFSNLFASPVTFRGGSVSAVSDRTSFSLTAGRVTVFQDMFGADAKMLGQTILAARLTHKPSDRLEVTAHASSVRATDVNEFILPVGSAGSAGVGARYAFAPGWRIVADVGATSYRWRDSAETDHGLSALLGAHWAGANGSLEIDAHRFAPGQFNVFNYAYNDRDGFFVNSQYRFFRRLHVDGSWELFRENALTSNEPSLGAPLASGARARLGFRLALTSRLFVGARIDQGSRRTGPSRYSIGYQSDTGSATAEFQVALGRVDVFGRYERRSDVGLSGTTVTFAEHDASATALFRPAPRVQLSSTLQFSRRRGTDGTGQAFWQTSTGGQAQFWGQRLSARVEWTVSGNRDYATDYFVPRDGLNLGLNGRLTNRLSVTLDAYLDHSPFQAPSSANPWATRTLVRLVYTLPTRISAGGRVISARAPGSPTGRAVVEGVVFADWNGDSVQDPGEGPLAGVTVVLDGVERMTTGRDGAFRFPHEAAGRHTLRVDLTTVSADYDLPDASTADVTLGHAEHRSVPLGLRPLGDINGAVTIGRGGLRAGAGPGTPLDNAVVVLDDGRRTEVTRQGRFHFSGVEMGTHAVKVLIESLPDGAAVAGPSEVTVEVGRQQRQPSVSFLVQPEQRPEIRKIFGPKRDEADPGR